MESLRSILTKQTGKQNSTLPNWPEPDPQICKFCEATLRHRPLYDPLVDGRVSIWFPPHPCSCTEGQAEAARIAAEEKRISEEREVQEREYERRETIKRLFKRSKLPARFQQRTFDTFALTAENTQALMTARDYAENFRDKLTAGQGLIFTGDVGTGKTHLAAAITLHLINHCRPVVFGTVTNLLGRIRNTYDDDCKETERQVVDELLNIPLLVIDDLGKEKPTMWVEQMVYEIINGRYEDNKPVIITTNTSLKGIGEQYEKNGAAIVSRIVEMCEGVKMGGRDWRKGRLNLPNQP